MKKLISIPVIAILFLLTGCTSQENPSQNTITPKTPSQPHVAEDNPSQPHVIQETKANIAGSYLGSDYKGNYVWGGAMNLAWNELNENILHEKLKLNTNDKIALEMVEKFNNPTFTKNDLDDKSYYIKSGYGQKTVTEINRESKKKFPSKSFSDLNINLSPTDIISYAYFLKEVEYKEAFEEGEIFFNDEYVKGFYASDETQKANIKIIKYENDDKFIIKLMLKEESDELILAKGYDIKNPELVVAEVNKNNQERLESIDSADIFSAPSLHLDYHREYTELIEKPLINQGFEEYLIRSMFENIKFDMDSMGARVENEGVMDVVIMDDLPEEEVIKPKYFILDKPYWIIMKRADSENPYFILGINNTELMEK